MLNFNCTVCLNITDICQVSNSNFLVVHAEKLKMQNNKNNDRIMFIYDRIKPNNNVQYL